MSRRMEEREMRLEEQVRECRVCGCTDDKACHTPDGPCHWVAADLCSACLALAQAADSVPAGYVERGSGLVVPGRYA